jgi:peptidoglycan DL-endopeptidase CwlO
MPTLRRPAVPEPLVARRSARRPVQLLSLVAAVAVLIAGWTSAAAAEPTAPPNEGGSQTLAQIRQNLEAAAGGYLEAEAKLVESKALQAKAVETLTLAELSQARLRVGVHKYAAEVYRTGRLGPISMMLGSTSPDGFLERAMALDRLTEKDQSQLAEMAAVAKQASDAKAVVDVEVRKQEELLKDLTARRAAAERALSAMGGYATTGWVDPNSPLARPAPRNANGSWPREGCTINDPTTSGCITPRTLHGMQQAKAAGFTRYVSCFRPAGSGEHPKGRACDFSANTSGFVDASAGGDNKLYGDKLASFFVKNASALGVMYVIWYCKIWINGGWRTYNSAGSRCGDDPAGDHTNHVHLSVY